MSLGQSIGNTGASLLAAAERQGGVNRQFLDAVFHEIASHHDRAMAAGLEDGVLDSLQGAADIVTAMMQGAFAPPEALAFVGCWIEGVAGYVGKLEGETPVPAQAAGAIILPFPGSRVVPIRGGRGDAA